MGKEGGLDDIDLSPPSTAEVKNEWNFVYESHCMAS